MIRNAKVGDRVDVLTSGGQSSGHIDKKGREVIDTLWPYGCTRGTIKQILAMPGRGRAMICYYLVKPVCRGGRGLTSFRPKELRRPQTKWSLR